MQIQASLDVFLDFRNQLSLQKTACHLIYQSNKSVYYLNIYH